MAERWVSGSRMRALLGTSPFLSPVYRDLADRIRMLVIDGRLGHEVRLPSERELSDVLALSRTTVAGAYADLRDRGYLTARRGAGNFVSLSQPRATSPMLPDGVDEGAAVIGLSSACAPAPPGVAHAFARAVEDLPSLLAGHGYLPDGLERLREELAQWYVRRGLDTSADQIVITAGALSALNIVARTLLRSGDRVLMETPTYPNAIEAIRRNGGRPVGFPVSADGWDDEAFTVALRQTAPRLTYLIPDFQNPTGACMDEQTRQHVAQTLQAHGSIPVVDETLVELSLDSQRMPLPLAAFSSEVITLGSASKAFWGGLRIGWIRAPRHLVRPLVTVRAALDLGAAPLEQQVTAELISQPTAILDFQRRRFAARRDHLVAELAAFPVWELIRPTGGLALWVTLPEQQATRLVVAAERHGLALNSGTSFHVETGGERHLRLPFTSAEDVLTEAVRRLARAYQDIRSGAPEPVSPGLRLTA
ncbi:PLP-dependent aminotransferase family protein [Microlunatus panaciterrae]|uniref:DNA-binding transcriptional MocR family regulator n=1 Tax=Microlunatus panaciterrae TaxID=400768 RepID=A0ABS2REJ6_9ACTN|nr:PLP-dependent aminotransferase family protein [Microlunatus panaciterrae]MBM7797153.1 DNA-binding transcriptional MocR family regulator [Microlunatus panaciterrae]